MKYWWRSIVKDYFTFTRRERIGLFVLIGASALVYFIPGLFKPTKAPLPDNAFRQELDALKITINNGNRNNSDKQEDYSPDFTPSHNYVSGKTEKAELFYFDPNTLDEAGWKKLGLRDKTIQTIQNFRNKGYTFRQPNDLRKIYGLRPGEADKLVPFVRIATKEKPAITHSNTTETRPSNTPVNIAPAARTSRIIDVNIADTTAFILLPGIGSKLASRIVNFRDKLGGFVSVEQVGETYGVPDSTFQKIKQQLQCTNPAIRTININEADINTLKSHPYIKWNIANAIYNYRIQHGKYSTVEGLKKIEIISDEVFIKIAPYLSVD